METGIRENEFIFKLNSQTLGGVKKEFFGAKKFTEPLKKDMGQVTDEEYGLQDLIEPSLI